MQHEPCGLLRDTQRPANLMTTDTVFAIRHTPHTDEPFIEAKWRLLENGADFVRKLLAAILAPEHVPGGYLADAV
jgi:hypothetical protein